jgi:hypothetical protein
VQTNLFAIEELAEGVLAETTANRISNARRLARHLWEFELELSFILEDPDERLKQWRAEEARRWIRTREDRNAPTEDPFESLLLAGFATTRTGGGFLPTVEEMASALGRADQYREEYRGLSYLSHPGLRGVSHYADVSDEDVKHASAGHADVDAVPLGRWAPADAERERVLLQALLSLGRALRSIDGKTETGFSDEVREIELAFDRLVGRAA